MPDHNIKLNKKSIDSITEPGKYFFPNAHGLFIRVRESQSKRNRGLLLRRWYQKVKLGSRWVEKPLGRYPVLSIKEASARALVNAQLLEQGIDPWEEKPPVPTLAEAAEIHLDLRGGGKYKRYKTERRALLQNHAPGLLDTKVNEIGREDIVTVLSPIWKSKHTTALRLQTLLKLTFEWANGSGHRGENPINPGDRETLSQLPHVQPEIENFLSLPFQQIRAFIDQIGNAESVALQMRLALEFKILSGLRSEEVTGIRHDEIDLDREIFTPQDESLPSLHWPCLVLPPERTKTKIEHVLPLTIRLIRILLEARQFSHLHPSLVFPAPGGSMISNTSLLTLQHRFTESVPHGHRDTVRTWGQAYRISPDVMETVLGHSIATHQGAYGRSILAGIRIYLMHDWSEYNYGNLPKGYRWDERFFPEEPDTYPDRDIYMDRGDVEALRHHLESDIAGNYYRGIQAAFETLQASEIYLPHKLSLLFATLTGIRLAQVFHARVSDIDVANRVWTILAENNPKGGVSIQVPLSAPAMEVYTRAVKELTRRVSGVLFPGRSGKELLQTTVAQSYQALGLPFGSPVFRSAFREWAYDQGYTERLIDQALGRVQSHPLFVAHNPNAKSEAARDWRTRVRMMNQWSDFLHRKGR